jgi:hypothetical protein
MNFLNSKTFMAIIIIVLMSIALTGCAKRVGPVQGPSQGTEIDSIAKMKSIGAVLGCIFAPNDPECVKLREKKTEEKPHQSPEEYQEENSKEWEKLDKAD